MGKSSDYSATNVGALLEHHYTAHFSSNLNVLYFGKEYSCRILIFRLLFIRYTVMSGTPQKMLEHLLETRLGGQVGPNDPFLDDFLLTHIVFMPVPILIDELANLYPLQSKLNENGRGKVVLKD